MLRLTLCEGDIAFSNNSIVSGLGRPCPFCESITCRYTCDRSCAGDEDQFEQEERYRWNDYVNGLEMLILALNNEGIDMVDPRAQKAIQTTIDGGKNYFDMEKEVQKAERHMPLFAKTVSRCEKELESAKVDLQRAIARVERLKERLQVLRAQSAGGSNG